MCGTFLVIRKVPSARYGMIVKAVSPIYSKDISMPKMKTHKGASKRFKKTGTGKIVRHHAFARHILTSKSRSRKRKLSGSVVMDRTNTDAVNVMLPY